jgi:pimeloyl-ACP methyl ester carboxylesterase
MAQGQEQALSAGYRQGVTGLPGLSTEVHESIAALAARFVPSHSHPLPRRYGLDIAGVGAWTVATGDGRCGIWRGMPGDVHAALHTDAESWLALVDGDLTGLDLFFSGDLQVSGDLNEALRLETMFAPPAGTPGELRRGRLVRYPLDGGRRGNVVSLGAALDSVSVEALEAGPRDGIPIVMLHGLGASKVSLLPLVVGLSARHRVVALDFPGFGKSSSPVGAAYDAAWFAEVVERTLDAAGIEKALLVGNSMGGRVSVELALRAPDRVAGLGLLCPAVAFDEYRLLRPFLQASRLDLALGVPRWKVPGPLPAWIVSNGLRAMFADHTRVPAANLEAAKEDFLRSIEDRRRRMAFLASARRIGLESPARFWPRLAELEVPSLWIFGDSDRLVAPAYAQMVQDACPRATVELWESCGHVPQFEHPQRTNQRLTAFFAGCN